MKLLVTGATGFIGSVVVSELLRNKHEVVGVTRSENGVQKLKDMGADAVQASIDDTKTLKKTVENADGVIHLAFDNSFKAPEQAIRTDLNFVQAMGEIMADTNKPLITTSHAGGQEVDKTVIALADKGIRSAVISLAPAVHDAAGKHGFVPILVMIAKQKGFAAYIEDGRNRWPAINKFDAAVLYRLAAEKAHAGSYFTGRSEVGVTLKEIAETIGSHLQIPVRSLPQEKAAEYFGFLVMVASVDFPTTDPGNADETKEILGWQPTHPGLIKDMEKGQYFTD